MKIVIITGGSGSVALQEGLTNMLIGSHDDYELDILINAYDDGLSTGVVRHVFGEMILGPSDVRKNHSLQYKLRLNDQMRNKVDHYVSDFMDHRFTVESTAAREYVLKYIADFFNNGAESAAFTSLFSTGPTSAQHARSKLESFANTYFARPLSGAFDYSDFSLMNILYAGAAAENGCSLERAATVMADIFSLKDNVVLNSDEPLQLKAETASGHIIHFEHEIDTWGSEDDPIVCLRYFRPDGSEATPVLSAKAAALIKNADLIILSSGTQWTTLIPTYDSLGFKEAIEASNAEIMMVMNREPDADAPFDTAGDMLEKIVGSYFPYGRIRVLVDRLSNPLMRNFTDEQAALAKSVREYQIGSHTDKHKHHAYALASAVVDELFHEQLEFVSQLNNRHLYVVMDFDDTLVARGNAASLSASSNLTHVQRISKMTPMTPVICTGNNVNVVYRNLKTRPAMAAKNGEDGLMVYADGGANLYKISLSNLEEKPTKIYTARPHGSSESVDIGEHYDDLIEILKINGIPYHKIEPRGDALICIRPIDSEYRDSMTLFIHRIVTERFPHLEVTKAGRTTIEIHHYMLSKQIALRDLVHHRRHLDGNSSAAVLYIGDEFDVGGNDWAVEQLFREKEFADDVKTCIMKTRSTCYTGLFLEALSKRM